MNAEDGQPLELNGRHFPSEGRVSGRKLVYDYDGMGDLLLNENLLVSGMIKSDGG